MADKKISALTAATTPLAGTEVLPIVQSGATVKVAVSDLTAGRTVAASRVVAGTSDSTVGTVEVATTSSGATTRNVLIQNTSSNLNAGVRIDLMTSGNTNRVAYIKAVNTSGGGGATDVLIATNGDFGTPVDALKVDSVGNITALTGNLIPGTAAKGVNFTANTPLAGMTSQLLNWYEEGTYTPTVTSGTGSITSYTATARYTRIGRQVTVCFEVVISNNGTGGGSVDVTLPFTCGAQPSVGVGRENGATGFILQAIVPASSSTASVLDATNLYPGGTGYKPTCTVTYFV